MFSSNGQSSEKLIRPITEEKDGRKQAKRDKCSKQPFHSSTTTVGRKGDLDTWL